MAKALLCGNNSDKNSVSYIQQILTAEEMVILPIELMTFVKTN